jgi:uncharacterized integral membrane protein
LSHLWQRFLLASALLIGLAIGVGATVFGYDNTSKVNLNWTVFHFHGIPLWTVAVVPVTLVLVAGTLFHWMNGLHHFTEHMRHRRRVHELEAELATLRAHLDQVLEMPPVSSSKQLEPKESPAALPEANGGLDDVMTNEPEPAIAETEPVVETLPAPANNSKKSRKRVKLEFGDATPAESEVTPEKEA